MPGNKMREADWVRYTGIQNLAAVVYVSNVFVLYRALDDRRCRYVWCGRSLPCMARNQTLTIRFRTSY